MERKRLLFVMNSMVCGGIEKAALALFSVIPPARFDVTLLLVQKKGDFLPLVPGWIKIYELPLEPKDRYELLVGRRKVLQQALRKGSFWRIARLLFRYCILVPKQRWRCVDFDEMLNRVDFDSLLGREAFDCAIAYSDTIQCAQIVCERVRARKRIAWFHTEYPRAFVEPEHYLDYYNKFDILYACSEDLATKLNKLMPTLEHPISFFPHFLNVKFYKEMACAGCGYSDDFRGIRILSVGRLSNQKGFDVAISVHAKLISAGYDIRWYVIGDGELIGELNESIIQHGVQDSFILLGLRLNPYPFFSECDLYVQPSRYEGYCLTVAEARAFSKPIVCTDFTGARDQIRDGVTGMIVKCDEQNIYLGVKQMLDHPELRAMFSNNLSQTIVDTLDASEQFLSLLEK